MRADTFVLQILQEASTKSYETAKAAKARWYHWFTLPAHADKDAVLDARPLLSTLSGPRLAVRRIVGAISVGEWVITKEMICRFCTAPCTRRITESVSNLYLLCYLRAL